MRRDWKSTTREHEKPHSCIGPGAMNRIHRSLPSRTLAYRRSRMPTLLGMGELVAVGVWALQEGDIRVMNAIYDVLDRHRLAVDWEAISR